MSSKTLAMKLIAVPEARPLFFWLDAEATLISLCRPRSLRRLPFHRPARRSDGGVQQFTATVSPSGANPGRHLEPLRNRLHGTSCGTIDATGKYTAPASVPNPPAVTARATSVADSAKAAIAAVNIMTAVNNSIPAISALYPRATAAGGPAFTLAVGGVNFVSRSVVRWNGSDRPTAFVNSEGSPPRFRPGDIAATGTAAITVFNPGGEAPTPSLSA